MGNLLILLALALSGVTLAIELHTRRMLKQLVELYSDPENL